MGWLTGGGALERRDAVNLAHPRDPVLAEWFGGDASSGGPVNAETAMRVSAVYACVTLISETLAAVPMNVMRRRGDRQEIADQHPLYALLRHQPNDQHTAFEVKEMLIGSTCLVGDSYARKEIDSRGRITSLTPLDVRRMRVDDSRGTLRFIYQPPRGGSEVLLPSDILRIPYKLRGDGMTATSPISVHRETIGLAMASKKYLAAFYRNSAQPKGALKAPTQLSAEAVTALRDDYERRHAGPDNAGKLMILDGGLEWQGIGLSNEDAQYVELQQMSVSDIARIFLVPPHKIGDLSKATFSNIEQQSIEFATDTLHRWCSRVESRANLQLLTQRERQLGYFIDFDLTALLRGDSKARGGFYRGLFSIGSISPNEIRQREGLNPYEGGDGYFVQGANVPIDKAGHHLMPKDQLTEGQGTEKDDESED